VGGPGQRRPAQRPGASGAARAQVPLGAGLGLKHKYKKDGNVAVAIYGDGCQNQGQIFEARFPSACLVSAWQQLSAIQVLHYRRGL
jgi:TPP-dependent pyruvate/acetoin dehydrogenase alpha subunit